MDILQINTTPPKKEDDVCYPKPQKPFPNISVLGLTLLASTVSNFLLRYIYNNTDNDGARAAVVIFGVLITVLCIGLYIVFALASLKKNAPTPRIERS